MSDPVPQFACPRCRGRLVDLRCGACRVGYPVRDGIPWLFSDPAHALAEWRNRFGHARLRREAERAQVADALARVNPGPGRARLERLAAGIDASLAELDGLLGEVLGEVPGRGAAPLSSHAALRTRLPPAQGVLTYEHNLFRDWCWGGAENEAARAAVFAMPGVRAATRILVLGAGAGRLAWDLHDGTGAACTYTLDINPLLVQVAARMARGETLTLTEFPLAPRTPEHVAIARTLQADGAARPGLVALLGDALEAPFADGTFDLVVTPWLLDILDSPVAAIAAEINRLLEPGGTWVSHGSVAFAHPDPAERMTLPELLARLPALGFSVSESSERELPYLCCPESRHRRFEQVATFAATRVASVAAALPRGNTLPDWITADDRPIPLLPGFEAQALATRTHAYIMSLIDGNRTRADLARVLAKHGLMDEAGARAALRGFLETMYEEARRAGGT